MKKRTRMALYSYFFLLPSIAVFALYRIIPFIWNLLLSFHHWKFFGPHPWAGITNYVNLWTDPVFLQSFLNTVLFLFIGSPVAIVLALGVALLVNRQIRGRNVYRAIVFIPYPITPVAIAVIWQWLYNQHFGLINYFLRAIGLSKSGIAFLQSINWALPAVMVTSIWQVVGFFLIIILGGLQSIPGELNEAATIDGATSGKRFLQITLPLLRPTIFVCFVVGIINSFNLFDLIYVMTNGGPSHSTDILITYIYRTAFSFNEFGSAAAMTVVMFAFLLLVTIMVNRLSGRDAGGIALYD